MLGTFQEPAEKKSRAIYKHLWEHFKSLFQRLSRAVQDQVTSLDRSFPRACVKELEEQFKNLVGAVQDPAKDSFKSMSRAMYEPC